MRPRPHRLLLALTALVALSGCATAPSINTASGPLPNDNTNAVLWIQTTPEYAAATRSLYAAATEALRRMTADDRADAARMAVVMDLDETVLDNSPYQAQAVLDNTGFDPATWDEWVALRRAAAIPGAAEFIADARAEGVSVIFITNRECAPRAGAPGDCPQEEDTLENLRTLGIASDEGVTLLRRERAPENCLALLSEPERAEGRWAASDKTARRACVEQDFDIVMLFGDQLGDFVTAPPLDSEAALAAARRDYAANWGTRWFMLPNPSYGPWLPNDAATRRARLNGIGE